MFSRPLTDGEIELLRPWFGEALDYRAVRVHRGAGLNPIAHAAFLNRNPAIALGRQIYVMTKHWRGDYAAGPVADFAGFIAHEAVHVWQWRCGRFNPLTYLWQYWTWPRNGYDIRKVSGKTRFDELGFDQQAEVARWMIIDAGTPRGEMLKSVWMQRFPG